MSADIETIIDEARNYAANSVAMVSAELAGASTRLIGLGELPATGTFTDPALPPAFVPALPPTLVPSNLDTSGAPAAPDAPALIPDPLDGIAPAPVFAGTAPVVDLTGISKPAQLAAFTGTLPAIVTDYAFPAAPDALAHPDFTMPALADYAQPARPQVVLPSFDALAPDAVGAPPEDYAARFTAAYRDAAPSMFAALDGQMDTLLARVNPRYKEQMTRLEDKLAAFMDGGSALSPAIETAIYERSRDKVNAEYRRTRDAAYADAAKRGLTMPSGALLSATLQARQAGADNNARAAIDIAIKQAELEQQNIQFAVTTSSTLRTTILNAMINYHQSLVAINGQALDSAKAVAGALIDLYNLQVKAFETRLESYKAEAMVYDTRLKAALSGITLYQQEIAALESLTRVDTLKIDAYKTQIESLQVAAGIYRSQVDTVIAKASLEKLKIDVFGSQVQAFTAQTQAKNAEWQGYAAAVAGEEAKSRVFATQVSAYAQQVSGWKSTVEARSEQVKAISANNQARAATYAATVQGYAAKVSAGAQKVSAETDFQKQLIYEYASANQAALASAQMRAELYRTQTQIATERSKLEITKLMGEAQIKLEAAKAIASNSVSAASVYGTLAGAAMAGMNTLVVKNDDNIPT